MPNDGDDFSCMQRQTGVHDLIDDRAATGLVEHFGETGFEARALASSEDENGDVFVGHGQSIVHWTARFDNRGYVVGQRGVSVGGGGWFGVAVQLVRRVRSRIGRRDFPAGGIGQ